MIMAAQGVPYVATASISYPEDFMKKVKKASELEGPAYIHLHQPCSTGWGFDSSKTIELGRLAVDSGSWILYEIVNGEFKVTYRPLQRKPVNEYLEAQKRFKHLADEEKGRIQSYVNEICAELKI
jgi:pyruvate ferredoxin oxidoreductase beta subunit